MEFSNLIKPKVTSHKSKVHFGDIPTSNAKSLACDTVNEHALERHAATVIHQSD